MNAFPMTQVHFFFIYSDYVLLTVTEFIFPFRKKGCLTLLSHSYYICFQNPKIIFKYFRRKYCNINDFVMDFDICSTKNKPPGEKCSVDANYCCTFHFPCYLWAWFLKFLLLNTSNSFFFTCSQNT